MNRDNVVGRLASWTTIGMVAVTALIMGLNDEAQAEPGTCPFVVRGCDFGLGTMGKGTRAFRNRNYVFDVVPEELVGWQFTRLGGGLNSNLRITAKQDTVVYGATSMERQGIDVSGWTRHPEWVLRYTDGGHTKVPVFSRKLVAGETVCVPEGSWTGFLILAPRLEIQVVDLHPEYKTVPGTVVNHIPASTRTYVGSPSIVVLPDGSYLASHDVFGPESGAGKRETCLSHVFKSLDRGETWKRIATIKGAFWSTLFVHRGDVYLMGVTHRYGHTAVRRSEDGGETWSEPVDGKTGLLLKQGKYHCAPVPVLVHNGRIWRAMEDAGGEGGWGDHFRAFMMSASVDADLLDAGSWVCSNRLPRSKEWRDGRFKGWLEGNAVVTPEGDIVDILRAEDSKFVPLAAVVRISGDGRQASFDPVTGFVSLPGGNHNKFTIRFDPESKLYWSVTNYRPRRTDVRNAMALVSSPDLRTWAVRNVVLFHPESGKHGFQYPDWQFDGDDLIVASRTAYDDGRGGAHNFHDANFLTFHRVENFRKKKMSASHPLYQLYIHTQDAVETKVTDSAQGHILTNCNVWSPDGKWLVYDIREAEETFSGDRIERVNVETGEVQILYQSRNGAKCGVATYHPRRERIVFIHGPENPTADWEYGASHRRGVLVDASAPGIAENLDARDLTAPFTPGALRGGTHVHTFSGDGEWVSSTYEDHVLAQLGDGPGHDINQRNVAVSVPGHPVTVAKDHPRNHDGRHFTVLATRTVNDPEPGSDEISRAFSDAWVGTNGYLRADGGRQAKAIAFQGQVKTADGKTISEVFIVDLPDDLTVKGEGLLEGDGKTRPLPPKGTIQRRLTHTETRRHPGLRGPRHWLRSSPDGAQIAFLLEDDNDISQIWTVSPNGGSLRQITRNPWEIQSAFSWSPDGRWLAYAMDNSVFVTEVASGESRRLTKRVPGWESPRHHCCVFSPDGRKIAFIRPVKDARGTFDQIFVVALP